MQQKFSREIEEDERCSEQTTSQGDREEHPKTSSSMHQVEQSHTVEVTKSASQTSSQRGALVGAIIGAALVFLIDVLHLRRK